MALEKQINLSAIFDVMWERGRRIFYFTCLAMIFSLIATLFIYNRYGAQAILMMNKSKLGERTMEHPSIPMDNYLRLITADTTMQYIIKKFELQNKPYKFKLPRDLASRIGVALYPNTSLIAIYAEVEDATMAANIANAIANEVIQINDKVSDFEKKKSSEKIIYEVNNRLAEVQSFKNRYLSTLKTNNKPVLINQVNTNMTIIATLQQQKETLDGSIVEMEHQLAHFAELFSATDFPKTFTTQKTIFADPVIFESIRQKIDQIDLKTISDLTFVDERVNTGYETLLQEYNKLKVDYPSRIAKRDQTVVRIKEVQKTLEEQQKRLSEMEVEETVAKADFDRSLEIFSGIEKQWGWSGTTVDTERQDLYLIREAIPITKKVFPQRSIIVGLVGSLAFLLSFIYYLLRDLYGLMQFAEVTVLKE